MVVHPDLEHSVVNKAWGEAAIGHATVRYLCDIYPGQTPIDIATEQAIIEQHDRIVFQFPLYWYGAPYKLKEWMDVVITNGWAYGEGGDKMEQKEIGVAVSCGGGEDQFSLGGIQCYPLATYMSVFEGMCAFVRAKYIGQHAIYSTYQPDIQERLPQNCQEYITFLEK